MRPADPAEATWTREHLLAAAAEAGLHATAKLIRNWEEEGLLDRATVRGLGPSRGVVGLWSENQRRLLLELLRLRARQDPPRNAPLANVPVWLWLAYGDGYVPVRQVRRALGTWTVPARHPAASTAEATARSVVERIRHPAATRPARRRLQRLIARAQAGELVGKDELVAAARPVVDPLAEGPRGPVGAPLSARVYGDHVERMVAGADAVLRERAGEPIPEFNLLRAREIYRTSRATYAADRAHLARDPDLGLLHADGSTEAVIESACHDLVLCVGAIVVSTDWRRRRPRR